MPFTGSVHSMVSYGRGKLPPALVGFSPLSIPGLQMWFDTSDASYSVSGNTVTSWMNKAGKTDATVGSGTISINQATLNGKTSMRFPAGSNYFSVSNITYTTSFRNTFFVAKFPNAGFHSLMSDAGITNAIAATPTANYYGDIEVNYPGRNGLVAATVSGFFNTSCVLSLCTSTGNQGIWVTGNSQTITTNNLTTTFFQTGTTTVVLGPGGPAGAVAGDNIDMWEFIEYDGIMTTTQRQKVEGYLAWKWGIQANLPSGHPYYSAKPMVSVSYYLATVPGLKLWLDGSDSTTLAFSSGSNISTWSDKSGNAYDATQFWTTSTVYNSSLQSVQFTDSTSGMKCSVPTGVFPSSVSLFVVYKKTGANNTYETLVNRINNSTFNPSPWELRNDSVMLGDGSTNYTVQTSSWNIRSGTSTTLLNFTLTSAQFYEYINGSSTYSCTPPSYGDSVATSITLGTRMNKDTQFTGNMHEVIIFNTSLTTTKRQQVEGYLAWKWGLQTSLPSAHPYYGAAPSGAPEFNGLVTTLATGFYRPRSIITLSTGNLLVFDETYKFYLVTPAGVVTTVAGGNGYSANGTGTNAGVGVSCLVPLSDGNVAFTDYQSKSVRLMTYPGGVITTLAGSGTEATTNGTGTNASFRSPTAVAELKDGNLVVVESGGVRIVTRAGVVTTLVSGINGGSAVGVLPNGNIVRGSGNQVLITTYPGGVSTVLAGGGSGVGTDGVGTNATFSDALGLKFTSTGMIIVADRYNSKIRMVNPTTGVVTTVAGTGSNGSSDGVGTNASFNNPLDATYSSTTNTIYVADTYNHIIRAIT